MMAEVSLPIHGSTQAAVGAAAAVPLTTLRRGESGFIHEARLEREDAALLRAMGVCIGSRVRINRVGDPIVVAVTRGRSKNCRCGGAGGGCRIGLARELAERIMVVVSAAEDAAA